MNIKSKDVELKHFLKADPFNEKFTIIRSDGDSCNTRIANGNEEFFDHIMLKCEEQDGVEQYIDVKGSTEPRVYSSEMDEWIHDNILNANNDTLMCISGFAGCGKTTWVQSVLFKIYKHKYSYLGQNSDIADYEKKGHDEYIDFYSSFTPGKEYSPEVIRFNIINSMVVRIIKRLTSENGLNILEDFCSIMSSPYLGELNARLPNIGRIFHKQFFLDGEFEESYFYNYATKLIRKDCSLEEFISVFRYSINGTNNNGDYIFSLNDLLTIDCVWRIAEHKNTNSSLNIICSCYDNLDIIDDFESLSSFINELKTLKSNISNYREKVETNIPYFIFFATYRKITASRLYSKSLCPCNYIQENSNESSEREALKNNIIEVDLSNLYDYKKMISKRTSYFKGKLSILVDSFDIDRLDDLFEKIIESPDEIFNEINYSALWNHNYRACNNVISKILTSYYNYFVQSKTYFLQNNTIQDLLNDDVIHPHTSILLHIIIKILNDNNEWEKSMGYSDSTLTTMSRLILTYLYNQKDHCSAASDIISHFAKIDVHKDVVQENEENNIKYICRCIQKMLIRIPNEKEEMWRRPLFYKSNALDCKNFDIADLLLKQYVDNEPSTSFVLSDEGAIFIDKIVPQFEFYSARISQHSKPLYCINDKRALTQTIENVYRKVSECCENQVMFLNRYMKEYDISKLDSYLGLDFHPTTKKHLKQLHIVRVIFSHIHFLNDFRNYLYNMDKDKFLKFNKIIVKYINKYLKLYDEKFYNLLNNSIGSYNNLVWNNLAKTCNIAINAIKNNGEDVYGSSIISNNNDNFNEEKTILLDYEQLFENNGNRE